MMDGVLLIIFLLCTKIAFLGSSVNEINMWHRTLEEFPR